MYRHCFAYGKKATTALMPLDACVLCPQAHDATTACPYKDGFCPYAYATTLVRSDGKEVACSNVRLDKLQEVTGRPLCPMWQAVQNGRTTWDKVAYAVDKAAKARAAFYGM